MFGTHTHKKKEHFLEVWPILNTISITYCIPFSGIHLYGEDELEETVNILAKIIL